MAIKFDITADNGGFLKAAQQSEDALQSLENRAQSTGSSIKDMFEQAAAIGGVSLGVAGMKQFVSKVYEVRSYFQDINSSMVAFLGNQEKANEFTNNLKDYAWYNMFEFSELAQASQQMIAYGANVEDIIPTIDKLSDIAVATKANLLDLVGMYNKAKSVGKVDSNATASWATHGLVIKNFLTETEKATDSASFTFEQLERAITTATSEGGLFYQQQSKMMDNLSSSWGQLQDDMDSMFNEIGEVMQKPMKQGIEYASELIDNYQEIAKNLGEIIAAYGLYKAAMAGATSMDRMAGNITTQAEVEALQQYIIVQKEVDNADLKELVTKGQLSQASYERISALRQEMATQEEQRAKELDAAVLRGQISEERANEVKSLRVKLGYQLDEARVANELAKSQLASAKAAKTAADEQVEWLQTLIERSEEAGTAEQTEAYTKQLQTAMAEQHNAALAVNTAQIEANTVAERLNALEEGRNNVMRQVSIKTMGLQKAAALQLKNVWSQVTTMIDSNPIMLYAAAIAGLAYGIYKLATAESEEEKARRRSNEAWDEFHEKQEEYSREIDNLVAIVQDENKTQNQRYSAWNKLKTLLPQITEEYKSMQELADADKDRLEQIKNETAELKERKQVLEDVQNAEERVAKARRMLDLASKSGTSVNIQPYLSQLATLEAELQVAKDRERKYWANLAENNRQAAEDAKPIEIRIQEAENNKERIDAAVAYLKKATDIMKSQSEDVPLPMRVDADTARKNLDDLIEVVKEKLEEATTLCDKNPLDISAQADKESLEKTLKTLLDSKDEWEKNGHTYIPLKLGLDEDSLKETGNKLQDIVNDLRAKYADKQGKDEVHNKAYWEKQKKAAEDKLKGLSTEQLDKITKGTADEALKKTYKDATKEYNEAVKEIAKYDLTGKSSKSAAELKKNAAERTAMMAQQKLQLLRAEEDMENELAQARINIMNDGAARQEEQRRLNHKKTLQNIERQKEDAIKAAYEDSKSLFEKDDKNKNKVFTEKDAKKDANYLKAVQIAEDRAKLATLDAMTQYSDVSDLVNEYQDYNMKKAALDEKYAADRKRLEYSIEEYHRKLMSESLNEDERDIIQRNEKNARSALAQLGLNYSKDSASLAVEQLKLDPSFVTAFQDLKKVSTDTLNSLYEQLQNSKDAMSTLDPENIKTIADLMNQIYEEQLDRDPFGALRIAMDNLKKAREEVNQSTKEVVMAQNLYNDALAEGDPWKIAEAQEILNEALEDQEGNMQDVIDAEADVAKAYEKIKSEVGNLSSAIAELGNTIGGTTGEILGVMSSTMDVVTGMVDGIKKVTGEGVNAISAMEKASVILSMVSMAFKFFSSLAGTDSKFAEYERAAEKQKEINDLRNAVDDYTLAVQRAKSADNQWFSASQLSTLKDSAKEAAEAQKAYYRELYEAQEKYQDEQKSGWGKYLVAGTIAAAGVAAAFISGGSSVVAAAGSIASMLGTSTAIGAAALATAAAGASAALYKGGEEIIAAVQYQANQLAAVNNLRIETQKKDNGWLGTGWGGHNQKTKDLRSWAKQEFGEDLFDDAGWVQVTLAQNILDNYADKLVGETKETLETLVRLKEDYDEFRENLESAVADLYSPIVDSFVDSLWDNFDNGVDALYAFKDKASDVFREIVSDMLKTIILEKIVGKFQEEVADLYEQYSFGHITEEQLLRAVSKNTAAMMDKYGSQVPVLQGMMNEMADIIEESTGVSIKGNGSSSSSSGSTGVAANVTQDSMNEANGRMTAIQIQNEQQIGHLVLIANNSSVIASQSEIAVTILDDMRTLDALRNAYLSDMLEVLALQRREHGLKLDSIAESLKNI